MSDGLDLFKERIRKLLEDRRRLAEQVARPFDPQVILRRLLGLPKSPGVYPPEGEAAFGRKYPIEPFSPKEIIEWHRLRESPPLVLTSSRGKTPIEPFSPKEMVERHRLREVPVLPAFREKTPEEKRKEIRKKYPFIGWQK